MRRQRDRLLDYNQALTDAHKNVLEELAIERERCKALREQAESLRTARDNWRREYMRLHDTYEGDGS